MAFSLVAAGLLASPGWAQWEARSSVPAYSTQYQSWPTSRPAPAATAPTPPPAAYPAPVMGSWPVQTVGQAPSNQRTVFYKKDPSPNLVRTSLQDVKMADPPPVPGTSADALLQADLNPKPEVFFRLESEAKLQERMRAEGKRISFPTQDPLTKDVFSGRSFAQMLIQPEPHFVCYSRLLCEDKNSERYGWNLGLLQPYVSAGKFFVDTSIMTYKAFSYPSLWYDCSAGHGLPGDPVPYYLYPPGFSITGGLAQAGSAVALAFIFP